MHAHASCMMKSLFLYHFIHSGPCHPRNDSWLVRFLKSTVPKMKIFNLPSSKVKTLVPFEYCQDPRIIMMPTEELKCPLIVSILAVHMQYVHRSNS